MIWRAFWYGVCDSAATSCMPVRARQALPVDKIQDQDAAGAGIGHIGEFSLCVDAYVVEVAVGQDGWCFQGVDFVNFVAPEVDAV